MATLQENLTWIEQQKQNPIYLTSEWKRFSKKMLNYKKKFVGVASNFDVKRLLADMPRFEDEKMSKKTRELYLATENEAKQKRNGLDLDFLKLKK